MSIGKKIKIARREAKLTQEELAQMTRMSRSHIAAIEIDAYNPSLLTLQRIAEVLRIPTSTLVEDRNSSEEFSLTDEQIKLLMKFKELNHDSQQKLFGYLDALLEINTPPPINNC